MELKQAAKLFNSSDLISELGTNGETGTGMGTSICKEFIHKHGGVIWVANKVNIGTTIHFTLPEYKLQK